MKVTLWNTRGLEVRSVEVRDDVLGVAMNASLVHQVMVGQLANARQGTASTKTRGHVSGGGRKIRPQKHTGAARAGTIRAPNWRGGGVVFGPHPRSYRQRTPKKMRRRSIVAALSEKHRTGDLIVLEALTLDQFKTSELVKVLDALDAGPKPLLVADGAGALVLRSARNIPGVTTLPADRLYTLALLNHRKVIMTLDALRRVEELWGGGSGSRKSRSAQVGAQA